jgi:NitT/TauT family transport system permease protein
MATTTPTVTQVNIRPTTVKSMPRGRALRSLFQIGNDIPQPLYFLIALVSFAIPVGMWCYYTYSGKIDDFIVPSPTHVWQGAQRMMSLGTLWPDTKISVYRISMGFLWSAVLAIPIGILMGSYKIAEAAHEPLVGFIRYIPVPALVPLIMVLAGIEDQAKILLIWIGTYFQMVLVVADVTRKVPRDLISAARTLGAKSHHLMFSVIFPATLPGLIDTCRTMIGWAWTYLIIAEVVACDSGLGYEIANAERHTRTNEVYVGILALGALGLLTDMCFKILTPRIVPWAEVQRG